MQCPASSGCPFSFALLVLLIVLFPSMTLGTRRRHRPSIRFFGIARQKRNSEHVAYFYIIHLGDRAAYLPRAGNVGQSRLAISAACETTSPVIKDPCSPILSALVKKKQTKKKNKKRSHPNLLMTERVPSWTVICASYFFFVESWKPLFRPQSYN